MKRLLSNKTTWFGLETTSWIVFKYQRDNSNVNKQLIDDINREMASRNKREENTTQLLCEQQQLRQTLVSHGTHTPVSWEKVLGLLDPFWDPLSILSLSRH